MLIVNDKIKIEDLVIMAQRTFGNMVKGVVDVNKEIIAFDADLHADLETYLLKNNSLQENLWGINIYPEEDGEDFLEFDSMINIRPSQNNRSRGIDDKKLRQKISEIVNKRIVK